MSHVNGVVIGLVTNVNDPEQQGRIKVRFPWLDDNHETDWIRIATMMSGNGRGSFFMPEVNDETLVAFDHGDTRFPYVIGFMWNGKDKPPESNTKNRTLKTPGGHILRFEDTNGQRKIILRSDSGHEITLDDSGSAQTITLKSQGDQTVVLDDKDKSISARTGGQRMVLNDTEKSILLQGGGRSLALRNGQVQIT